MIKDEESNQPCQEKPEAENMQTAKAKSVQPEI
jgi:hypothetical protein